MEFDRVVIDSTEYSSRHGARTHTVGDILYNSQGEKFIIKSWIRPNEIYVQFDDGSVVKTNSRQIINGRVKNKNSPRIFGIGYIGEGKYRCRLDGKITREYSIWEGMLKRVYSNSNRNLTYRGCEVCKEWHDFQNFAEWITNLPQWKFESWQLDKDISGQKMYSKETCFLVPREINNMFVTRKARNLPRGVSLHKTGFQAQYGSGMLGGRKYFKSIEDAHRFWKDGMNTILQHHLSNFRNDLDPKCVELLEKYNFGESNV